LYNQMRGAPACREILLLFTRGGSTNDESPIL
jgi:hypothetical protein